MLSNSTAISSPGTLLGAALDGRLGNAFSTAPGGVKRVEIEVVQVTGLCGGLERGGVVELALGHPEALGLGAALDQILGLLGEVEVEKVVFGLLSDGPGLVIRGGRIGPAEELEIGIDLEGRVPELALVHFGEVGLHEQLLAEELLELLHPRLERPVILVLALKFEELHQLVQEVRGDVGHALALGRGLFEAAEVAEALELVGDVLVRVDFQRDFLENGEDLPVHDVRAAADVEHVQQRLDHVGRDHLLQFRVVEVQEELQRLHVQAVFLARLLEVGTQSQQRLGHVHVLVVLW